jgi:hypothetical protein
VAVASPIRWLRSADPSAAGESGRLGDWSELPAIERASGEIALTAASLAFAGGLASRRSPGETRASLRRERSLEGPRGLVHGIARVLDGGRSDGPDLVPAPPGTTRRRRPATHGISPVLRPGEETVMPSGDGNLTTDDEPPPSDAHEALSAAQVDSPLFGLPRPRLQAIASAGPAAGGVTSPLTRVAETASILPSSGRISPSSPSPSSAEQPSPNDDSASAQSDVAEEGPPSISPSAPPTRVTPALAPDFRPRRVRGAARTSPSAVMQTPGPAAVAEPVSVREPATETTGPAPAPVPASPGFPMDLARLEATVVSRAVDALTPPPAPAQRPTSLGPASDAELSPPAEERLPTVPVEAGAAAPPNTSGAFDAGAVADDPSPSPKVRRRAPGGPSGPLTPAATDVTPPSLPSSLEHPPAPTSSTRVPRSAATTSVGVSASRKGRISNTPVVSARAEEPPALAPAAPLTRSKGQTVATESTAERGDMRSRAQPSTAQRKPVAPTVVDPPRAGGETPHPETGADPRSAIEPTTVTSNARRRKSA